MLIVNKDIKRIFNSDNTLLMLFYVSIFLLPTNLFLVWRLPESYIQGHFIDYLAPKLYLQQFVLWLLFLVWGVKSWNATRGKSRYGQDFGRLFSRENTRLILLLVFAILLGARALLSEDWGLASLIGNFLTGPVLLAIFLWKEKNLRRVHLVPAVVGAVAFQAFIGMWQWLSQDSVLGYYFFGEPNLRLPEIAQSSLPGALRKLPYGTTPHPNILAGWLVLGVMLLFTRVRRGILWAALLLLFLTVLLLTESWTAWGSLLLLLGFAHLMRKKRHFFPAVSPAVKKSGLLMGFLALQVLWLFLPQVLIHFSPPSSVVAETSWTRRALLQQSALQQVQEKPFGTSFSQMFQGIFENERSYTGGRFLQPPHNSVLLLVTIGGLWVIIVLFLFLYFEHQWYSLFTLFLVGSLPLFGLDHYTITTISGQFLIIIISTFANFEMKFSKPR